MRRTYLLVLPLLLLVGCGTATDGQPAAAAPASSASPSAPVAPTSSSQAAATSRARFDVEALCAEFCAPLKAAGDVECATEPFAYWQCAQLVTDLSVAFDAVAFDTPPDVAYRKLTEATEEASAAADEFTINGCSQQQTGDAGEVCSLNLSTVRFAATTVGVALSAAP